MTTCLSSPPARDEVAVAAGLVATDEQFLALAARLPLAPLGVLAPFLRDAASTAHRRAGQLCDRGLLTAIASPLRTGGRPARLLLPSEPAVSMLARRRAVQPAVQAGLLELYRTAPTRLLLDLPGRLAAYELLALLAAIGPGLASLDAWERPWRRLLPPSARTTGATPRPVRLPAAATLTWDSPDGMTSSGYLLVPDTGGLALPALRAMLGRVAEHQAAGTPPATLVIATTTARRAAAWATLLETVCQAWRLPLLEATVATWSDLRQAARAAGRQPLLARGLVRTSRPPAAWPSSAAEPSTAHDRRSATPARGRVLLRGGSVTHVPALGPLDRAILDLVGRHTFVPTDSLAALLGRDVRWTRARLACLAAQGLVRVLPADEVATPEQAQQGLLELTREGLQVLAAHLGLALAAAVRHHGLAGGGPATPVGPRAALLAQLSHTLGADAVFMTLARAAATCPGGGALLEWRSAAACTRGRLRPDGYGLLRLGHACAGFLLEFDRGTMRPGQLRAKFAAYHRYRASARAARDYDRFPTILVVTTGPGAEERIVAAVTAADVYQSTPLPVLVTTTGWIESHPEDILGPIWREPRCATRRRWPAR